MQNTVYIQNCILFKLKVRIIRIIYKKRINSSIKLFDFSLKKLFKVYLIHIYFTFSVENYFLSSSSYTNDYRFSQHYLDLVSLQRHGANCQRGQTS